jgi:hypothetical protein
MVWHPVIRTVKIIVTTALRRAAFRLRESIRVIKRDVYHRAGQVAIKLTVTARAALENHVFAPVFPRKTNKPESTTFLQNVLDTIFL